jgi:hypothetical protein
MVWLLFEHDLFPKTGSTFLDHAPGCEAERGLTKIVVGILILTGKGAPRKVFSPSAIVATCQLHP